MKGGGEGVADATRLVEVERQPEFGDPGLTATGCENAGCATRRASTGARRAREEHDAKGARREVWLRFVGARVRRRGVAAGRGHEEDGGGVEDDEPECLVR